MTYRHLAGFMFVIASVSPSTAHASVPGWCKDSPFTGDVDLRDLSSKDPEKVLLAFAHATCAPSAEVVAHQAGIDQNRQAWGKRLGLVERDWADVVAYANANEGRNTRLEYSTKDLTRFTPLDQYKAFTDGFPSTGGNFPYKDSIYVADVFAQNLSEVGRYGYLKECFNAHTSATSKAPPAAEWAICQGDFEKLDLAKLYDQLRTDTAHPGDTKMKLRFELFNIGTELKEHAADIQAAWKTDPVYKKMFEVAAAARAEWAGGLAKETKLLELALRMDAAKWSSSRKQQEGCEAATASALATAVSKIPAATFKAMKDERTDPFGGFAMLAGPKIMNFPELSLAAIPYILCQPTTGTADFLAYYLQQTAGLRGPHTMAHSRLLDEKLTLDDRNEHLYWPEAKSPRMYGRTGAVMASAGGVIASTQVEGELISVTLEPFVVKSMDCVARHSTNKISRILPSGDVQYETICDKIEAVTHTQLDNFKIKKVYAPLLKKGVKFSAVNGAEGGADILVVWPNKAADVPTWMLGGTLK